MKNRTKRLLARLLWRAGELFCFIGLAFAELSKMQLDTAQWLKERQKWRKPAQ